MSKSKKDLLKCMPSGVDAQKAIKSNVNEIVNAILQIDSQKELIASIKEVAEEKYGVSGAYVEEQAKLMYDNLYNDKKAAKKILEKKELLEEFEGYFLKK